MDKNDNYACNENAGVDPSEVLKQVLERVANSPAIANDIASDLRLKKALAQVFNQQKIHQILAMDSMGMRKYRSEQSSSNAYSEEGYTRVPIEPGTLEKYPTQLEYEEESNVDCYVPMAESPESKAYSSSYASVDSGPNAALWPRKADQFAFSQEDEEDSNEDSMGDEHSMGGENSIDNVEDSERIAAFGLESMMVRMVRTKRRTGFEDQRDFVPKSGDVIVGRYRVVEKIGQAAFSTTYRCEDEWEDGVGVCVKVIKNNKDYFDQGLDEIQILKLLKRYDPWCQRAIVRIVDYFYFKEHLMIVMELLDDNLYDFGKKHKHYFTMENIKSIMKQMLEGLVYVHALDIIHCDLKPENIVLEVMHPCRIKIIDFGSSCFTTDYLSSYIQSRSYRAPEVLLGLPYDMKIDIWSLGCIAAELHTGRVLFTNDCSATLLARIISILGDFPKSMLQRGKHTSEYFTATNEIFVKQDNDEMVLLKPKVSSLQHRLKTSDALFIDFVTTLLQVEPNLRPTAQQALEHPWLAMNDWES